MEAVRAARRLARNAGRAITFDDLMATVLPKHEMPPDMLFRVTVHEAAHAVIALEIPVGSVPMVRLNARGTSPGQTNIVFDEGDLLTRESIEERVTVLLAGRAAERIFTGVESTGSGGADDSDLSHSTAMIAALYVSDGLGGSLVYLRRRNKAIEQVRRDPVLRQRVDCHLHDLQERADRLVEHHRASILAVAMALADKGHLSGSGVAAIMQATKAVNPKPPAPQAPSAFGPDVS
jgi:ATP-dependent Zn protease